MKRDQAVAQAREQLAATGIAQTVRMAPDGEWDARPITALRRRCADCGTPLTGGTDLCVGCSIMYHQDEAEPVG